MLFETDCIWNCVEIMYGRQSFHGNISFILLQLIYFL